MATLAPQTILGTRYKILSPLGRGGMAQVYRATDYRLRKDVALKVLDPELAAELGPRFEREAHATARLDHPGCVRIIDYGRTPDRHHYIAMELLDGPTLAAELAREPCVSTARAVSIARNLLAALVHAHREGILHRDIKPENVMLARRGGVPRTVLIDFGLARLRDEGPLTAAGICLGSPSYLAPERLLGRAYDARADLYAIGVVLYEMLAGSRPFVGDSPQEILRRHLDRPPRPLRATRRDVSPALESVVLRALAKEPARRFGDAEQMLSALDGVPLAEQYLAAAVTAAREEEAATLALEQLAPARPSLARRIWSRLRYGSWRWSDGQMPAGR